VATIRPRKKQDGSTSYHVMVRLTGFPTRTASLPTRRAAKRWAATIEGEMVEGRHFKDAAARRRTVAEAIDRYLEEEVVNSSRCRHSLPLSNFFRTAPFFLRPR
jgi:hypothetical protein